VKKNEKWDTQTTQSTQEMNWGKSPRVNQTQCNFLSNLSVLSALHSHGALHGSNAASLLWLKKKRKAGSENRGFGLE